MRYAPDKVLTEDFITQATAAGAECHRVAGVSGMVSRIVLLLQELGVNGAHGAFALWAAGSPDGLGDAAGALRSVPGLRFDVSRETASEAQAGISAADWGVAQTGTLVCDSTAASQRLASTLPLTHIALLWASRIVPDMASALSRVDPLKSRYIAAITGPSRTADIERVLTIGVHGPKRLIILIVEDPREGAGHP